VYSDKVGNRFESLNINDKNGYFLNGRLYGMGKIQFKNGDKYKGEFKDGRMCGTGTLKYYNINKDA
jgi:hypothetical protein